MIAGCDRRDAWVGLSPDLKTITSEPTVGKGNTINESEMALFSECMQSCARKVLDTGRHCQRRDVSTIDMTKHRKCMSIDRPRDAGKNDRQAEYHALSPTVSTVFGLRGSGRPENDLHRQEGTRWHA